MTKCESRSLWWPFPTNCTRLELKTVCHVTAISQVQVIAVKSKLFTARKVAVRYIVATKVRALSVLESFCACPASFARFLFSCWLWKEMRFRISRFSCIAWSVLWTASSLRYSRILRSSSRPGQQVRLASDLELCKTNQFDSPREGTPGYSLRLPDDILFAPHRSGIRRRLLCWKMSDWENPIQHSKSDILSRPLDRSPVLISFSRAFVEGAVASDYRRKSPNNRTYACVPPVRNKLFRPENLSAHSLCATLELSWLTNAFNADRRAPI